MRIVSVTPYYSPEGGGLERYADSILRRLEARGHDVQVHTFTRNAAQDGPVGGVEVHRHRPRFVFGNSPVDPAFLPQLAKTLRSFRPDVVLGHTPVPFAAEMAFLAASRARLPFVATYHSGRLHGTSPFLSVVARLHRATLQRRMLASSAKLIAVAPYVRDHALAQHKERVTIIRPGVDAATFSSNTPAPERVILHVAPLSRSYAWKGIDVLWDAFKIVHSEMPDAVLRIVGVGDRLAYFRARAMKEQLPVEFLGRVSETDLVDAYRRSTVLTLPSITDAEAFPCVLVEANACSRPVVASRIGGIPDFVRDGENGFLARAGDPADLAAKLLLALEDPDRARSMGRSGRERVVREHNWDNLAAATESVLEQAIAS